ncbi:hypothetical protein HF086_002360 [Spodoptera exigua]|uniref:Ion transport domain-containing protein n=1 Tax=Spodoptera exigua TaxID=7107 RepID=A0A922MET9_SPOEX|nr:hypothetical protein HF086_002360 [Spodoptera exigua]
MTLTIFCLMVFALFALQVYMGELRNKCVKNLVIPPGENFTDEAWSAWIQEPSNWMVNADEVPIICGNLTGARHCPPEWTCLCVGPNPNHGYTNFDNFLWSMLTTFQLITLDYWENVYNMNLHIAEFGNWIHGCLDRRVQMLAHNCVGLIGNLLATSNKVHSCIVSLILRANFVLEVGPYLSLNVS